MSTQMVFVYNKLAIFFQFVLAAMTMRMQKDEQEKTADLVKEHSKQMLELLAAEQAKIRLELEQELVRNAKQ